MHMHCELLSVVSLRIGTAQEVHASFGYEQSKLISSHLTLASIQLARRRAADCSAWRSVVQPAAMLFDRHTTHDDDDDIAKISAVSRKLVHSRMVLYLTESTAG